MSRRKQPKPQQVQSDHLSLTEHIGKLLLYIEYYYYYYFIFEEKSCEEVM